MRVHIYFAIAHRFSSKRAQASKRTVCTGGIWLHLMKQEEDYKRGTRRNTAAANKI